MKRGFGSPNYPYDRMKAMQRKGGKRKVAKGFAMLSIEERRKISSLGGKTGGNGRKKKKEDPFDV